VRHGRQLPTCPGAGGSATASNENKNHCAGKGRKGLGKQFATEALGAKACNKLYVWFVLQGNPLFVLQCALLQFFTFMVCVARYSSAVCHIYGLYCKVLLCISITQKTQTHTSTSTSLSIAGCL